MKSITSGCLGISAGGKNILLYGRAGRTDGLTDGRSDGRTDGRTDGLMDGRMDERTVGLTDGRADRRTLINHRLIISHGLLAAQRTHYIDAQDVYPLQWSRSITQSSLTYMRKAWMIS